jgi:hypothetical protein
VVFALLNALHHRAIKQDLRSVEIATAFRRRQRGRS